MRSNKYKCSMIFTVSTPALNIKIQLTLISLGVSSPLVIR